MSETFNCEICNKPYKTAAWLVKHKATAHPVVVAATSQPVSVVSTFSAPSLVKAAVEPQKKPKALSDYLVYNDLLVIYVAYNCKHCSSLNLRDETYTKITTAELRERCTKDTFVIALKWATSGKADEGGCAEKIYAAVGKLPKQSIIALLEAIDRDFAAANNALSKQELLAKFRAGQLCDV